MPLPFRSLLACFASLFWLGHGLSAADPATDAPREQPFKVTAEPTKTKVRFNETFKLVLRVVNVTDTPQHIRVMNCSWDEHWQSSNPQILHAQWPCTKNFAVDETIVPGAAYSRELEIQVMTPAECRANAASNPKSTQALGNLISEGLLAYKMGFSSIGSTQIYWSNEIKIEIVP